MAWARLCFQRTRIQLDTLPGPREFRSRIPEDTPWRPRFPRCSTDQNCTLREWCCLVGTWIQRDMWPGSTGFRNKNQPRTPLPMSCLQHSRSQTRTP